MDPISPVETSGSGSVGSTANQAFGLGFEDLLRIVLTQLTYQDPLKPIENFEFVSQLAQFSQIQQTQTMSDRLLGLLQAGSTTQATSLLGKRVEIPSGPVTLTGKVVSVSFQNGEPRLTLETDDARTIANIALSSVNRITQGN
ncbi:flagellar hook capping FlgD N-terminal domain-containing protein [Hyphomonas sp.]|uniref:flagellar hook assembly protein FlgD n=1 Tax=Hyphomonas sp. TaxID=87 RepID=UPI000A83063D|nr:flagellar hook capping FlgD N-terminal domain-containing protein [Hyphomonas sp.]